MVHATSKKLAGGPSTRNEPTATANEAEASVSGRQHNLGSVRCETQMTDTPPCGTSLRYDFV